MQPFPIRRTLTAFMVTALALAAGAPAVAAPKATVDVLVADQTPAPNADVGFSASVFASRPIGAGNVRLLFHLQRRVPGVLLVPRSPFGDCFLVRLDIWNDLQCERRVEGMGRTAVAVPVDGSVRTDATAVPGSVETMTVTLTIPGYAPVVRTSTIRVGEPIDLVVRFPVRPATARPGGSFDTTLPLRNDGANPIRGLAILGDPVWSIESRVRYRNCWYIDGRVTGCLFDQELAPRTGYRFTLPFRLRHDTYAPSEQYTGFVWLTRAQFDDRAAYLRRGGAGPLGVRGTGDVLRLEQAPTAKAAEQAPTAKAAEQAPTAKAAGLPQSDPKGNEGQAVVVQATGVQSTDLAAVGDRVSGRAGAVVTVSVGVDNKGPATIDTSLHNIAVPQVAVTIPPGTTAVAVPMTCSPQGGAGQPPPGNPGVAGFPRYLCSVYPLARAGKTFVLDIDLRIDRVVTNARGTVRITQFPADLVTTNNTALIVVNPPAAKPPTSGPPPAAPPAAGPPTGGGGGDGGGLAITGPRSTAAAGIGVLLIVAGALCLLIARRRGTGLRG